MNNNPIFIIGVQRSGTTLLRLMLNAHSEIAIPEEARFLTPFLKPGVANKFYAGNELKNVIRYLNNNGQFALWNYDSSEFFNELDGIDKISVRNLIDLMYSSYSRKQGKHIWGDKSLFFGSVSVLHELFPEARFIHIVRDGRDVFDSWRKMDKTKGNPAVIALDWVYKERAICNSFSTVPKNKQLSIRYEDLLSQPENLVKSICMFLDIPYEAAMLEFYKSSPKYIGNHHSKLIFSKIDNQNTQKWKKNLSRQETAVFTCLSRSWLNKYGYQTNNIALNLTDYASMLLMLSVGIPYRAIQILSNKVRYSRALKQGMDVRGLSIGEMPREKQ